MGAQASRANEGSAIKDFLCSLVRVDDRELNRFAQSGLTGDTVWDVAHPLNRINGIDEVVERLILPIRQALTGVFRRDELFICGRSTRENGGDWCASVTHYVGNFSNPLFGAEPSNKLVYLRSGEFYRIERGKIAEAKLILDFPDLMRQAGRNPLPNSPGVEMAFPSPATHDGVLPNDPERGAESLKLVERMLENLGMSYDPVTLESPKQTGPDGCWHPDMQWYGPGGIGSNYRWDGFVKDHRRSFLEAFPDRAGGDHYCRIGDGAYAAVSGWPSMTMTHVGPYLGVPATGRKLTLRVMDFYRCQDSKIIENWVLLDYGDLFLQMGVDLFARARSRRIPD